MKDREGFRSKVIENKIIQPTKHNFSAEKWRKDWEKASINASSRDEKIYTAGIIIGSLLEEVRKNLILIYKRAPKISYEKLMLAYVASSNRTTAVALKLAIESVSKNIPSTKINANPTGQTMGVEEIAHAAVDGSELAIKRCLEKIKNRQTLKSSKGTTDKIKFIGEELSLSQLYSSYVHLWHCILWSDYELVEVDNENKNYIVKQPSAPIEIDFLNSINRKSRLNGQRAAITYSS